MPLSPRPRAPARRPVPGSAARPLAGYRRILLKGVGGLAATSVVDVGGVVVESTPAQVTLNVTDREDQGRMRYYNW